MSSFEREAALREDSCACLRWLKPFRDFPLDVYPFAASNSSMYCIVLLSRP